MGLSCAWLPLLSDSDVGWEQCLEVLAQHLEAGVLISAERYCPKLFTVKLEVVVLVRFCLEIRAGSSRLVFLR